MKKTVLIVGVVALALLLCAAAPKRINRYIVQNPNSLEELMNAVDDELDELRVLANELRTDHATYKTVVDDIKTLANNLRTWSQGFTLGNPSLGINSNFDIKNDNAVDYAIAGKTWTLTADQNFDTGTAAAIPANTWGVALLSVSAETAQGDQDWTRTVTWATNSSQGYATEVLAIAAIPSLPADHAPLGYVTVQSFTVANAASTADTWDSGTDALENGSGGTAAQNTNYYSAVDGAAAISSAVSSSSPATITAPAVTEQVTGGR